MRLLDIGKQSLSDVKVHNTSGEQKLLWWIDRRVCIRVGIRKEVEDGSRTRFKKTP